MQPIIVLEKNCNYIILCIIEPFSDVFFKKISIEDLILTKLKNNNIEIYSHLKLNQFLYKNKILYLQDNFSKKISNIFWIKNSTSIELSQVFESTKDYLDFIGFDTSLVS